MFNSISEGAIAIVSLLFIFMIPNQLTFAISAGNFHSNIKHTYKILLIYSVMQNVTKYAQHTLVCPS